MKKAQLILLVIFFANCCHTVYAQDKMETDRPDQTETPFLIPKKYFQAELGLMKQNDYDKNWKILYPTALLKYGLSKRVELDLEFNYTSEYKQLIPNPETTTGIEPVSVGTKVSLFEEKGLLPKTSVIAHVGLPFAGSKNYKTAHVIPTLRLTMQHTLTPAISVGYNFGAEWDGTTSAPEWIYTLVTGFELSEKWQSFIEIYGAVSKHNLPENSVDAGLSYNINNNMKIDASAGFGLTKTGYKNFISTGFSFRFPTGK